jgi:hypothetical protein
VTRAQALTAADELRHHLLDAGVRAVSIELVEGRSGSGWYDDRFVGTMGHHIVSRRSQGLTPGLNLVKVGRTDLPGPLCNGYGGFDEIARIICMGWANHPGAGGPYTVPSGTIPANNGRPYLFGWEHEGGISEADWTPSFREFMGRCHAGTLTWLGLDEQSHIEHKTWAPTRKVDRLNYTLGGARAEIRPHLQGDTMGYSKLGDPIETIADADKAFAEQGTFFAGQNVASYLMGVGEPEARKGILLGLARITDKLMQHDTRLRAEEAEAGGGGGLTSEQIDIIVNQRIAGTTLQPPD